MSDSFFSAQRFTKILQQENCDFGAQLVVHTEIDSTSTDLLRRLSEGAPLGTLVVAQTQTGGRGRSGNSWFSKDTQNLYISFAEQIQGAIAKRLPLVPLAAGVAAAEALQRENIKNVSLKWPNDLLLDRKKVGGILCETPGIENDAAVTVVGLGLNLGNQTFPPELQSIATHLPVPPKNDKDWGFREKIAARWVCGLYRWCRKIEDDEEAQLISAWKQFGEPFGRRVKVGTVVGRTVDLNSEGRLLVQQDNNKICSIPGGMVETLD